jgi:uncharacterized protein (TIGR02145 family)
MINSAFSLSFNGKALLNNSKEMLWQRIIYEVTTATDGNGTITASPMSGVSGTNVTLSNTPNSGYTFSSYDITGAALTGSNFKFTGSDVTVKAWFRDLNTAVIGGRTYRTVTINGVTWLAENLDYGSTGVYYNNDESTYGWNGLKYGKLYTWDEAVAAANEISGWHLATAAEWDALADAVGGKSVAGTKLKSSTGWSSGNGTDDFGFAAFPAGYQYSGYFVNLGSNAYFWTATETSSSYAYNRYFSTGASMGSYSYYKSRGYSVRLVKDA